MGLENPEDIQSGWHHALLFTVSRGFEGNVRPAYSES